MYDIIIETSWIITIILLTPVAGAIIIYLLKLLSGEFLSKYIALIVTLGEFILTLVALWMYGGAPVTLSGGSMYFRLVDNIYWIKQLGINYTVGVDMLSLPFVILTSFITLLATIASWDRTDRPAVYFSMLLILETGLTGTFVFLDMFFFFIAWEVVLIPMFFLIGIFGGPKREYAAIYFFIYTHLASLVLLLSLLGIYFQTNTFSIPGSASYFATSPFAPIQSILFIGLFLGFIVKVPTAPFHTWLPLAHVEAPSPVSMLLAGVLLKMGGYGILRFNLTMFSTSFTQYAGVIADLGILSVFWGGYLALQQSDLKRLVAYSSVSHMGLVLLGAAVTAYTGSIYGVLGAVVVMLAHGLISPFLFVLCGTVQHFAGTREIASLQGITQKYRGYGFLLTFASLASLGLPFLIGFVGEFLVILSAFTWEQNIQGFDLPIYAALALLGLVLVAGFYLFMLKRIIWGEASDTVKAAHRIHRWEYLAPLALLIPIVVLGVFPYLLVSPIVPTIASIAQLYVHSH